MSDWLRLGYGGLLARSRIILVGRVRSKHIRRLLAVTDDSHIINLTYGYPQESALLLDDGYIAIVSITLDELEKLLQGESDGS